MKKTVYLYLLPFSFTQVSVVTNIDKRFCQHYREGRRYILSQKTMYLTN